MKHIKQLVEYITGMDTRIGYPNEHLAGNSDVDLLSPSYATAVGLLMKGLHQNGKHKESSDYSTSGSNSNEETSNSSIKEDRKSIFEKWADKFREFLDNAE